MVESVERKELKMIDNILGYSVGQGSQFTKPEPITDEEKAAVQGILSQYDPANVTAEDAKSIFQSFRQAHIRFAPGMRDTIADAGFDPEQLRQLAAPQTQNQRAHHHHNHTMNHIPEDPTAQGVSGASEASGSIDISI
jgi:hypothetical protein